MFFFRNHRKCIIPMLVLVLLSLTLIFISGCGPKPHKSEPYYVGGKVVKADDGNGLEGVTINFSGGYTPVVTDNLGTWSKDGGVKGKVTITPTKDGWSFNPPSYEVSAESYVEIEASPSSIPSAPTNFAMVASPGGLISFTWTDNSNNEAGFRIEYDDGGSGTYHPLTTIDPNSTSHSDAAPDNGFTRYYRIYAYNASGNSTPSNVVYDTSLPKTPVLYVPDWLSDGLEINWEDWVGELNYHVERSDDNGVTFTEIAKVSANTTSYQDRPIPYATYQYRVRASNINGYSDYSTVRSVNFYRED